MRDFDRQKAELRKQVEDSQSKFEKLQKAHRALNDELRGYRTVRSKAADIAAEEQHSQRSSTRNSIDSLSPSRRPSSAATSVGAGGGSSDNDGKELVNIDYVKHVILQSLEVKDKKIQMQMLPVLKMLLKFDKKDEARWMTVVSSIRW